MRPGPLEDPVISAIAARVWKDAGTGTAGLDGTARHGFAYHARSAARARENFVKRVFRKGRDVDINRIQTRQRLNEVVKTGIPGFKQGR